MTQIEQIKAKIEKRFNEYSTSILKHYDACIEAKALELGKILTIIDSLPEEFVSEDLDTCINIAYPDQKVILSRGNTCLSCGRVQRNAFKAGANWQKEQDFKDMLKSDNTVFEKVYEKGKADMKEQMMKNAKEITVECLDTRSFNYCITHLGLKRNDMVKVILIKDN